MKANEERTKKEKGKRRRLTRYWRFMAIYTGIVLALNVLSRITAWCDFYVDHIFWIWAETYGRFTSLFPFSVGEVEILVAVLILVGAIVMGISLCFLRKKKRTGYKLFAIRYEKATLVFLLTAGLIMTLNCSMLYHCSYLLEDTREEKEFSEENLRELRNYVVKKCNTLSAQVEREEDGTIKKLADCEQLVREAVSGLQEEYPRFSGYIPVPKGLWCSYYMYVSDLLGIYFPFSMEANYNTYINGVQYPFTTAHELSHLKGYIYEKEANFFAFLACAESEDTLLQYSAYLNVLDYVDSDYAACVSSEEYLKQVQVMDQVWEDDWCYDPDTEKALMEREEEEDSWISSEVVEEAQQTFTDTYLEYYGAEASYSEVTELLLEYYAGKL